MKLVKKLATVTGSLVVAAWMVLTSGCATSKHHATSGVDVQCCPTAGAGHASHQGWAVARGSLVSPFGDAPGERDLELTRTGRTMQSVSGHACAGCDANAGRIAASR